MQAVILAGGKGTRLAPYTTVFPKPMLPVGDKPIIEIIIQQLSYYGFTDIVISLGYLGQFIEMYFSDDHNVPEGVNISYVRETKPLGTSGPVSLIDNLEERFLVINGDILTTINYSDMYKYHIEKDADLTIAMAVKKVKMDLGVLEFDKNKKITNFDEKPVYNFHDNIGIYIYNRSILKYIEKNKRLDMNDLVMNLIRMDKNIYGYLSKESYYWIDIGKHGDYDLANQEFEKHRKDFLKEEIKNK